MAISGADRDLSVGENGIVSGILGTLQVGTRVHSNAFYFFAMEMNRKSLAPSNALALILDNSSSVKKTSRVLTRRSTKFLPLITSSTFKRLSPFPPFPGPRVP